MTVDERKTLETLATSWEWAGHNHDAWAKPGDRNAKAAAIRSALATIDALTGSHAEAGREIERLRAEVETLHAQATEAQDLFNICDGERLFLRESADALARERDALRLDVAELRARAIPAKWIERAFPLTIDVTFSDHTGAGIALNGDGSVDRYDVNECGDHYGYYNHETLAAALDAAAKES